jgi:calcineurin-like phosphoesterase
MKKLSAILILFLATLVVTAQTQILKSSTTYQSDINYIKKKFDHTITIDAKTITITKFKDNSQDLKFTINKTEEKEWSGLPCTWHYCTTVESRPEKAVVIVLPKSSEVDVFMYIQEVYPVIYKMDIDLK